MYFLFLSAFLFILVITSDGKKKKKYYLTLKEIESEENQVERERWLAERERVLALRKEQRLLKKALQAEKSIHMVDQKPKQRITYLLFCFYIC